MLFNSLQFLIFFPAVALIYFATPHRHRWILLLVASYYFYMCWKAEYVLLLLASTMIDYVAALRMSRCDTKQQRKKWLMLSLCSNLGMLFGFKYANFASQTVHDVFSTLGVFYDAPVFNILLPVGISFYTFQTLSYTIDVYRGHRKPQPHIGKFAVFVAFFPQLVAGPIERSRELLPQFDEIHVFDYGRMKDGLQLMLWGFFKKLVIADQAAIYVNAIFGDLNGKAGLTLLVASYLFAFQIYCDFSGYTDIAIGASRVMGFRLTENFRRPYFSKNISEFWQRWHITLSTWFRDYVFVPLSMSRFMRSRLHINLVLYVNLLITWTLVGLWHGAAWHFVLWGVYQAVLLIGERLSRPYLMRMQRWSRFVVPGRASADRTTQAWVGRMGVLASIVITFHFVLVGLLIFRVESVSSIPAILVEIVIHLEWSKNAMLAGHTMTEFCAMTLPILFLMVIEIWQGDRSFVEFIASRGFVVRLIICCALILGIACLGVFDAREFIYFQF